MAIRLLVKIQADMDRLQQIQEFFILGIFVKIVIALQEQYNARNH